MYVGEPLANVYELPGLYTTRPEDMPPHIACPVKEVVVAELVETSPAKYGYGAGPTFSGWGGPPWPARSTEPSPPIVVAEDPGGCGGRQPCYTLTITATNIIESYQFKIRTTLDNEMAGQATLHESPEITLTVSCRSSSSELRPSVPIATDPKLQY